MSSELQGSWHAGIYPDGTAFIVLKNMDDIGKQIEFRSRGMNGSMGFTLWKNPSVCISMGNIPFDSIFEMLFGFMKLKGELLDEEDKERLQIFEDTK